MKILHFVSTIERGGIERQLQYIVNNMPEKNKSAIAFLKEPSTTEGINITKKCHIIKISRKNKWDFLGSIISTIKIIKKTNPDIIHLWFPPIITIPAALIAKVLKIPIVSSKRRSVRFHGDFNAWCIDQSLYIQHILSNRLIANFQQSSEPSLYKTIFKYKKGIVIPNGFPHPLPQNIKNCYKIKKKLTILFAGRIVEQKRLDILIKSFIELSFKRIQARLIIAGEIVDKKIYYRILKDINKYNLQNKVFFLGYRKDWHSFIRISDIFALPSMAEGMPNVLFEAMLHGIPCITTKIPEIESILKPTDVFFIDPGSKDSLTKGIVSLYLSEKLRRKTAIQGKRVSEKFLIKNMTTKYITEYKKIL